MSDDDELLSDDELAALADVDALLADPALWESPSAAVEDQVVALIGEARRTATGATPAPLAPVVQLDAARARRRRGWSLVGAALAGAAAAALITGVIVSNGNDSTSSADGAPATFAPGGAPQELRLTGTQLAPTGVGGSASLTAHPSGVEIQLSVPGLPTRTGGDFYQVWAKNCDGSSLVPAGSFHDLSEVTGWIGVSMDDYPVLTVTKETAAGPKDAGQASSGEIVATGTIEGACPS